MSRSSSRVVAGSCLLAGFVLLTGACSGGESAAPRDPLAGSASTARQVQRNGSGEEDVGSDNGTSHPAKSIPRGAREKHYK